MDVLEAIRKRRSVRSYKPDEIPGAVLDKLLEAMRLAPSGVNRQPWKFIVVKDKETKEKIAAACHWNPARPTGQPFIAEAPVVIVCCGSEQVAAARYRKKEDGQIWVANGAAVAEEMKTGPVEHQSTLLLDLAIAMEHLALTALEEGLGTCWIEGMDEPEVKKVLGVPDDIKLAAVMPVGYPTAWPEPRPRKPLDEIVSYDRYR